MQSSFHQLHGNNQTHHRTHLTGQRDLDSNLWLVDLPTDNIDTTVTGDVAVAVNNSHKPAEIVALLHLPTRPFFHYPFPSSNKPLIDITSLASPV
jgi:hypothetical protein